MMRATATVFFTDLASEANSPPEWVQLFPPGPVIKARDGRQWTLEPKRVVAAFAENKGPLAIDYEHAQAHMALKGGEAPAAGWIVEVEERAGGVWGKVEWVARAAQQIADRAYRFLSPEFAYTADDSRVILKLNGAGLVNRPALVMQALSRETPQPENTMSLKAIAAALGLANDADETAVLAAITASQADRTSICSALKLDTKSDATAIATAITSLQAETETALAAVKASPAATEVAALKTDLAQTRTALASLQQKDFDREVDGALDAAAAEGKITPASRDSYRAMCADQSGLDRFKALASTLPVICAPSGLGKPPVADQGETRDPVTLAALARKHQADQAALGVTVSISDAVAFVEQSK